MQTQQEIKIYYDKNGVLIRDSIQEDIEYLSKNMRNSDVLEIWASHHKVPSEALQEGLNNSDHCFSVVYQDRAIAMFGVVPVFPKEDVIWFLSTEELFKIRLFEFVKHSRFFIDLLFEKNSESNKFFNFVDARNTKSIKWLKSIGAKINIALPYGEEKLPFHYFEFLRRN